MSGLDLDVVDVTVAPGDKSAVVKAISRVSGGDHFWMGGFVTEYEERLGRAVARVITGGDVPAGTIVTEQWLLDLEREAFLSLCGERKTLERIQHMLKKGKPLRN